MPKDEDDDKYQQRIRDFIAGLEEGPGILSPADEAQRERLGARLPIGTPSLTTKESKWLESGGLFGNLSEEDKAKLTAMAMGGLGAASFIPGAAPVTVPAMGMLAAGPMLGKVREKVSGIAGEGTAGAVIGGAISAGLLLADWRKAAIKAPAKLINVIRGSDDLLGFLARQSGKTKKALRTALEGEKASKNLTKLLSNEKKLAEASERSRGLLREALDQTKGPVGRAAARHPRTAGLAGQAAKGAAWMGGGAAALRVLSGDEGAPSVPGAPGEPQQPVESLVEEGEGPENPVETAFEEYTRLHGVDKTKQRGRDTRLEGMLRMQNDEEAMKRLHRVVLSTMVTMASRKMALARYLGSRAEQGAAGAEGIDKALANPEYEPHMFLAPKSARMQAMFAHHGMEMPEEVVRKGQDAREIQRSR